MDLTTIRLARLAAAAAAALTLALALLPGSIAPAAADAGTPRGPLPVRPTLPLVGGTVGQPQLAGGTSPLLPVARATPSPAPGSGGGLVLKPDLLVIHTGVNPNGNDVIEIRNQGGWKADTFRVAVLAGADSYSFSVLGIAAGGSWAHVLPKFGCNRPVVILTDADHKVDELLEDNNSAAFKAACPIDGGVNKVPESE